MCAGEVQTVCLVINKRLVDTKVVAGRNSWGKSETSPTKVVAGQQVGVERLETSVYSGRSGATK